MYRGRSPGSCGGYFATGQFHRRLAGQNRNQNVILTALCRAMGVEVEHFGDEAYRDYTEAELSILTG